MGVPVKGINQPTALRPAPPRRWQLASDLFMMVHQAHAPRRPAAASARVSCTALPPPPPPAGNALEGKVEPPLK